MIDMFLMKRVSFTNYYIFPVRKYKHLENLRICIQCSKVYIDSYDNKDYGICSVDCGMKYRGLSWRDFV